MGNPIFENPEDALKITNEIVGEMITNPIATWGAAFALVFDDVQQSDCNCDPCVRVRQMLRDMGVC